MSRTEPAFNLLVEVSYEEGFSQAFVSVSGGNRLRSEVLEEIACVAIEESPLTKEFLWNRGSVWRPINPELDGDSVTVAFMRIKTP